MNEYDDDGKFNKIYQLKPSGSIVIGQGDIGITAAGYDFIIHTTAGLSRDSYVDLRIPIGFGYQCKNAQGDCTCGNGEVGCNPTI